MCQLLPLDFRSQMLVVFNPSVVCCCLLRKCVIFQWMNIPLACEKLHQMWSHTGYQEGSSSAGPPVPAVTPMSCWRNSQQRKQEPAQCCCDTWKRHLMFRRLKKKTFSLQVYGLHLLRISQALKRAKEPCAAMRNRHIKSCETWGKVFQLLSLTWGHGGMLVTHWLQK